jgi:P4 family phage/plasmid primase-like protien
MQNDAIHLENTTKFLNVLNLGGNFTFQTFTDKKDCPVYPKMLHGRLEDHAEELKRLNRDGAGVFVAINETNGNGRKASDIVRVRAHFIDSDYEPIEEVCKRFPLPPHMIVETSEGKGHAYYIVSDTPLAEFKAIQDRLIKALGTDPAVKDLPRVMRLPGFYHMKGDPRLVKLIHVEEGLRPYSKEQLLSALPVMTDKITNHGERPTQPRKADPAMPQSDGTRTETLTSLVGQFLAKGIEDEEIFKWITLWNSQKNTPPLPEEKLWSTIQSMRKSDQHNHPERYGLDMIYTDTGNAKRLVTIFGEDIRYCHDRGEWMFWNGRRWLWDDTGEIVRKAKETAASIYSDASKCTNMADMDKASRWAKQSLNASGLRNMVTLAQSDLSVATTTSRLDRNLLVLNVSNGTIDLESMSFRTHAREDLITKMAHIAYEPRTGCPTWLAFLNKIFGGDQELISWLQKVVGYTLTGSIEEQMVFFLIGDGCNGKSTFLNVLKKMMGDYAVHTNPDSFMVNKFSSAGAARSDLMRLYGARMVVGSEGEEGQRLAESFLKRATGGEEISGRGLYQKHEKEFESTFKFFFGSNHKPKISGTDYGIWRRIKVIPFSVCIPENERDPKLMSKLSMETSGILNWAYEGCARWQEEGLSDLPAAVAEASKEYQGESDVIGRFLEERCGYGGRVGSSELYQAYSDWSQANGEDRKTTAQLSQYLMRGKFTKVRSKSGFMWTGLQMLDEREVVAEQASGW